MCDNAEDESGGVPLAMLVGLSSVDQAEELNYTLPVKWIVERFLYPLEHEVSNYYVGLATSARFVEWLLGATNRGEPKFSLNEEPDRILSKAIKFYGVLKLQDSIKLFFRKNTYLHKICDEATPTSAALRSSVDFYAWREILIEFNIDMESFVTEELSQAGTTIYHGWTVKTLLCLFQSSEFEIYKPTSASKHVWSPKETCPLCRERHFFVDVPWQCFLERIKSGQKYTHPPTHNGRTLSEAELYPDMCLDCWQKRQFNPQEQVVDDDLKLSIQGSFDSS